MSEAFASRFECLFGAKGGAGGKVPERRSGTLAVAKQSKG